MVANQAAPPGRELDYKWVVLVNTTVATFMSSLDNSILAVSMPQILRSLHASVVEIMWVVMGYSLMNTALLLPLARLADMKGRVRLYNLGFVVFTLASALCGFSQSGMQLVISRLVQGIGAALLMSNSTALITDAFPSSQRGFALSINMTSAMTGFIMGTVLGGVITEFLGWRYIFFLNLPVGTFAASWAFLKLHEIVEPERKARFDLGGMVTFPLGIASILMALTFVVMGQWGEPLTNLTFALGAGLLVVFLAIERQTAEPMMDLSLFRIRVFWAGNTSHFLNALARGATTFIMTWYFQAVLNNSPLQAGVKLLPMAATMMICSPIAGRLSDRFGSRVLSTLGLGSAMLAQFSMSQFPLTVRYEFLALALVMLGAGNAFFNAPNTNAVMGSVPSQRRGVAAGTRTLLLQTGQTMAIASAMAILSTAMSYQTLVALFAGQSGSAQALDAAAFMNGLHKVFLVNTIVLVVAIVCSSLRGSEGKARPRTAEHSEIEREVALA